MNNFYLVKTSRASGRTFLWRLDQWGNIFVRYGEKLSTPREVRESSELSKSKVSIPREQVFISFATDSFLTRAMPMTKNPYWLRRRSSTGALVSLSVHLWSNLLFFLFDPLSLTADHSLLMVGQLASDC